MSAEGCLYANTNCRHSRTSSSQTWSFGGGSKISFHPCGFLKRGNANVMQAFFSSSDISNSHMFVLKIIRNPPPTHTHFSKHLLLKGSNPLYSLVLHSAALVLLCVDKSLWVHASLICPTGEDVDGLEGRCRCLLLSLDMPPPLAYSTLSGSVCCCTVVSPFQACLQIWLTSFFSLKGKALNTGRHIRRIKWFNAT